MLSHFQLHLATIAVEDVDAVLTVSSEQADNTNHSKNLL